MTSRRKLPRPLVAVLLSALVAGAVYFLSVHEPEYRGKKASAWFNEYVSAARSRTFPSPAFLHRPGLWGQPSHGDPALQALLFLGPKAVPTLTRPLRGGLFDSPTYAHLISRLPSGTWDRFAGTLPNPAERSLRRIVALELLAKLGPEAKNAVPALLDLLRSTNGLRATRYFSVIQTLGNVQTPAGPAIRRSLRLSAPTGESLRDYVVETIVAIHETPEALMPLLSELGRQRQYRDLVDIARAGRCGDPELMPLLGAALGDSDPVVRQKTMRLIESADADASVILDKVIATLGDADDEVRWFAARMLEATGASQPAVRAALQTATNDASILVRTVALRALAKLPQAPADSADAFP
ncbi:MAG: hypothetical protein KIT22_11345 [Verrucomicrobiae bacterium]|nr:hypothetical protein [Verrucomicrobiae bacterium]